MTTVATQNGIALTCWVDENDWVRVGPELGVPRDAADDLALHLECAAAVDSADVDHALVAGRTGAVWVIRWPYSVGIHDRPRALEHGGVSLQLEDAQRLSEAVKAAAR
jgi:hypothetical protein